MDKHQLKCNYKRRFRALVHLVTANMEWLVDGLRLEKVRAAAGESQLHNLTLQAKIILNKNPLERSEEEKHAINKAISGLRGFSRYSDMYKSLLSDSTTFAYYGPGRTILRKKSLPVALYFIVDGECEKTVMDGTTVDKKGLLLKPGYIFGAKSLLHNIRRMSTVSSVTSVQLLVLKSEFCQDHSRNSIKREWEDMDSVINKCSYFDTWPFNAKTQFCLMAKIKYFEKGETILGDGFGSGSMVYFLLKGKCQVIEHLLVKANIKKGTKKYELYKTSCDDYKSSENKISRSSNRFTVTSEDVIRKRSTALPKSVETHFMQVIVYSEMACFGVGENMERRRIVALTDVKILNIPRYWLYESGDPNVWHRIRRYLDTNTPSTEMVYRSFLDQEKWRRYCKDFTSSSIHKQPCNTINNIPYSIRINQDVDFLRKTMKISTPF